MTIPISGSGTNALISFINIGLLHEVIVSGTHSTTVSAPFAISGTHSLVSHEPRVILSSAEYIFDEAREPLVLSGTSSYEILDLRTDIPGEISVSGYAQDIEGLIRVVRPSDIPGEITVVHPYVDLDACITVVQSSSSDIPGEIIVEADLLGQADIPGTITIKPFQDIDGSISVSRPLSELHGVIKVGDKELVDLSGLIHVSVDSYLESTLTVSRPALDISGTIYVPPHANIPGVIDVVLPHEDIAGSIEVLSIFGSDISGTIDVTKPSLDLGGIIETTPIQSKDLDASITVNLLRSNVGLQGAIIVVWGSQLKNIPARIDITPYMDIAGEITTERPSNELSGTISVKSRFDNNLAADTLFTYDTLSVTKVYLDELQETSGLELIEISNNDEDYSIELLPYMIHSSSDVIDISQNDSFDTFLFSEETVEWSYAVQITDNLLAGNDFSLPTVTEIEGRTHIAYNHNFNNELRRTMVVKSQDGGVFKSSKWIASNIYDSTINGQFIGPDGEMIHEHAGGISIHPGPQKEDANSFFESEIVFTPESYDIEASMHRDLWVTIEYRMQRDGHIEYPPKQWLVNPLSESIASPRDIFDSIPKHDDFTPTDDGGHYQDFNNFFTGNG